MRLAFSSLCSLEEQTHLLTIPVSSLIHIFISLLCDADYSKGFGGKFGVQSDRQDKSALGYQADTHTELHPSQTDMKKGFGGRFGVEEDRKDQVGDRSRALK